MPKLINHEAIIQPDEWDMVQNEYISCLLGCLNRCLRFNQLLGGQFLHNTLRTVGDF